jgi:SagB-type dehydrogenase family enzyme
MTRFLSRLLDNLSPANINQETTHLFAYHQATKHTYHSVRANARDLDWSNQPDPFRTYDGAPITILPPEPGFPNAGTFGAMAALDSGTRIAAESDSEGCDSIRLDASWLSRLLWHSMAISAWKKVPRSGSRYSLRVNPSSGNLHPTETYLALAGFTGVDDGLYHYRADLHAVEFRSPGPWTAHLAQDLRIPWAAESSLIIGLTSIFWREAWKYRDRAYRYCCHDLGHATMSLLLAARALRLSGGAITHFADARLTRTLGLTGGDEAPMVFLTFPPKSSSGKTPALPQERFAGVPNELSAKEVPYELLLGMHRSTILPEAAELPPHQAAVSPAMAECQQHLSELLRDPARDSSLGAVVRRRRSALDFDVRTPPMERSELEQLVDFATRDWQADWRGNFGGETVPVGKGTDFVTLYLYVHRVRGCEPGVYRWDGSGRSLEQLHRANVERVAAYLSLEQSLAGNACFAVSMIADLAKAAERFGNRGYRYVHFEAGAIGQRLYLGAEALGWNATGIGAFYDDDVHRYLGFLEEEEPPVGASLPAAEQSALVIFGSPSDGASAQHRDQSAGLLVSESGEEQFSCVRSLSENEQSENEQKFVPRTPSSTLPRQVIYHFAVGRAVPDERLEA